MFCSFLTSLAGISKINMKKTAAKVMTQESPEKVFSLLIASLFSMAFLFAVTTTDASFAGAQTQAYDLFAPQRVVSVLDSAAASYSKFISNNFLQPLTADYTVYADNRAWILKESGVTYALGIDQLTNGKPVNEVSSGQVAGASIVKQESYSSGEGLGIDSIYSLLIR